MPQLDSSFYISELFWLFISFMILFSFVKYYVSPRMYKIFEEREAKIAGTLRKAEKLRNEAMKFESEYNAKLNHAYKTATIKISKAVEEFNRETQIKRQNRDKESVLLLKEAEKRINEFRKKTEKEMLDFSVGIVTKVVEESIAKRLDDVEQIKLKILSSSREVS